MKQVVKKILFPIIALVVLSGIGLWLYKTETVKITENEVEEKTDKNFNSNDSVIIEERHMGLVRLDTLRALIADIGWNDKVEIETDGDAVSFLLVSLENKDAYRRIFFNDMAMDILLSREFETPTPLFTVHDTDDTYGYTVKLVEKNEVDYAEIPFEFLLGITDERGRQKASN
ncbi:MAG: hypothetical protein Aureis2KO_06440 [Aureisphaera sp.]